MENEANCGSITEKAELTLSGDYETSRTNLGLERLVKK
jgi:hypothetical protein